jgi:hypothetical protein
VAGKNPHEAVTNFLHPIQSVLACFTDAVLDHKGGYDPGRQHLVMLPGDQPIRLRADEELNLYFSHRYVVVESDDRDRGPWKVKSLGYRYRLDSSDGTEVVAYHWHPDGKWKFPHLHVNGRTAHFPTQRIAIEDVLELAVRDFGVRALPSREKDWERILKGARERFVKFKTW